MGSTGEIHTGGTQGKDRGGTYMVGTRDVQGRYVCTYVRTENVQRKCRGNTGEGQGEYRGSTYRGSTYVHLRMEAGAKIVRR